MRKFIALVSVILATFVLACSPSIDIEDAHCQQEDMTGYTLMTTGLWDADEWDAQEAFSTEWSGSGYKVQCLTLIYDSVENARWSLNYSTALQRLLLQEGLLTHRQIAAPKIGDDNLAFEVEAGQHLRSQQLGSREAVATIVMFRRGTAVVMVDVSCCPEINPIMRPYMMPPPVGEPTRIAHSINKRILSD